MRISAQNAAILVTRRAETLVFEQFELSPLNEAVVTTRGRLVRTFPSTAVAVSAKLLQEADFTTMVATTLETMCQQTAPGMQPQSKKKDNKHDENRNTTNPAMVSELFFGVLEGMGESLSVAAISKNTRDEVLWSNAKEPWRRSPMWLLIRVALQLVITRAPDGSLYLYKEFMVFMICLLYTSPSPRDGLLSRMPSSA